MNIVVIGHVDHGKSTLIGRLLADTGTIPTSKLEQVRDQCQRTSKPFEYAFLLDALKDERSQGITIDSARCFFRSAKRQYVIIDAPGHIEFLKNMISGAARAEAGILIIDAKEGIRENSRRHGYLLSLLGIRQLAVCVNKMDLVGYDRGVFEQIREEYSAFLARVGISPKAFIPIVARDGGNVVSPSPHLPWYTGATVLDLLDSFTKALSPVNKPFRFPVQDIYKFTALQDERRIVAGRVETGIVRAGDPVAFLPSGKRSRIASIEGFQTPPTGEAHAGQSTGFTLHEQVYVTPGEIMVRAGEPPPISASRFRVTLFWLGRQPMIRNKRYKLKINCTRVPVWLAEVHNIVDASYLKTVANRQEIERHDIAECTLETIKPVAFDPASEIPQTGRFVVIDHYEIAGGGTIVEGLGSDHRMLRDHVRQRENRWERTPITPAARAERYGQRSALVVIGGPAGVGKARLARSLEEKLFRNGRLAYYLGVSNSLLGINADLVVSEERDEYLRRLGETAHLFTDAGLILITTVSDLDDHELALLETLNDPNELVVIAVGENPFSRRPADLVLEAGGDPGRDVSRIAALLHQRQYLPDYQI
jgi:bifunctional enzyme CysN/CysC